MDRGSSFIERVKLGIAGLSVMGQLMMPGTAVKAQEMDQPSAIEQKVIDPYKNLGFNPLEFVDDSGVYYINADTIQGGIYNTSQLAQRIEHTVDDHPLFPNVKINSVIGNWSFSQGITIDRETLDDPSVLHLVTELERQVKKQLNIDPRTALQDPEQAPRVMKVMAEYISKMYPNTDAPYGNDNDTIAERIREEHVCFDRAVMLNLGLSAFGFNETAVASFYQNIHGVDGYDGETTAHAVSLAKLTNVDGEAVILLIDPTGTKKAFTVLNIIDEATPIQEKNSAYTPNAADIFVGEYKDYPKPRIGPIWIDNFTMDGIDGEDLELILGAEEYQKTVKVSTQYGVVSVPISDMNASSLATLPFMYNKYTALSKMCRASITP